MKTHLSTRLTKSIPCAAATLALLATVTLTQAVMIADFEGPTYTADSTFIGTAGWQRFGSGADTEYLVTPSPTSGYNFVIAGSQSAVMQSVGYTYKSFQSAGVTDGDVGALSWLQGGAFSMGSGYQQGLFLGTSAGSTPMGILGRNVGGTVNIWVSGGLSGELFDTGITYQMGGGASSLDQVYRFTMELDFQTFTMQAYYEDVTQGGARTALYTPLAFSNSLTAEVIAADYGVLLINNNFFGAGYDNIEMSAIPEPSSLVLSGFAAIGAMMIFSRRSRQTA